MAEDKKEGENGFNLSKGFSSGLVWAIVGAILGVVLSSFAIIDIGVAAMSSMLLLLLGGGGFGLICGFIYGVFPKNMKIVPIVLVIGVMIIVSIFLVNEAILNTGWFGPSLHPIVARFEGIGNLFTGFGDFFACFSGDSRCPFIAVWEDPKIGDSSRERINVERSFSNKKIRDGEINLLISLGVTNPENRDIRITPKCHLGNEREEMEIVNPGAYCSVSECIFPPSEQKMSTNFICFGTVEEDTLSEDVYVAYEIPVEVETTWNIEIQDEVVLKGDEKPKESEMDYNAPYTVALASKNPIPFELGETYNFELIIKKNYGNVKFKKLESLTIVSLSEVFVYCPFGSQLVDIEYEQLKEIADYYPAEDKFKFLCSLDVAKAYENAVLSPIVAEVSYTVESEDKVIVSKQV